MLNGAEETKKALYYSKIMEFSMRYSAELTIFQ
jgi:hypothetical protein